MINCYLPTDIHHFDLNILSLHKYSSFILVISIPEDMCEHLLNVVFIEC